MDENKIAAAFEALIQERGIYKTLEVDRQDVYRWKTTRPASLGTMLEMLLKAERIKIVFND